MPTVSTHPKSAIGHESTNIFHHHHHNDVIQPTIAQEVLKIFSLASANASVDESIRTNGTDIIYNITFNETFPGEENEALGDWILMGMLSVLLGLMILVTVIGNVFVIAAIFMERNLQNVANHLIVSLAVADLMVACLVMPLGAVYVISNNWIMGAEVCDMWITIDVLCCTASILHLVAIAMDRYWAVTNVVYTRNSQRIRIMIILIWSVALIVSLAPQVPQFGWKDPEYMNRIKKKQCLVSQDVGYQIFATSSTFYAPLLIIFILYWKIFQTARKRIRKRREMRNHNLSTKNSSNSKGFVAKRRFLRLKKSNGKAAEVLVTSIAMVEGQSTTTTELLEEDEHQLNGNNQETKVDVVNNVSPEKISLVNESSMSQVESEANRAETTQKASSAKLLPSRKDRKETLEAKRERKAAKTLAIITGAFVICWLPFFILALVMPLCGESCSISPYVMSFFLWLGYFNSTLNPVIYTVFNPEFRQAFKRILCGQHRKTRRNLR